MSACNAALRVPRAALTLATMLAILVVANAAMAQKTIVVTPDADATLIKRPAGNKANGRSPNFHVGRNANGGLRRALLHFDVESRIPVGSVVHSVALDLRLTKTNCGHKRVSVHRVLKDWTEGPSYSSGGGGQGADSMEGDVTWIDATYGEVPWDNAGGDHDATPLAALGIIRAAFYTFENPALTAEVQAWVSGDRSNHGLMLIGKEDDSEISTKRFASREAGTPMNRPVLTVTFTPPAEEWCKLGTVDLGASGGMASDVLFLNSSIGDETRTVRVDIGEPIVLRMEAPPAGPKPSQFVLYLHAGKPTAATVSPQPAGIGDLCFPSPLNAGDPMKIWNNIGHEAQLGHADYPSEPAPTTLIDAPEGADRRAVVTLQGIMLDSGSAGDVAASITNAIVLDIR